jgi:hypothetical protein
MLPIVTLSWLPELDLMVASPELPEMALALSPPAPPLPPTAVPCTLLIAAPVLPDVATAEELAPLLAELSDAPTAVASPVGPEFPVFPDDAAGSAAGAAAGAACAAAVVGGDAGAVVVVVDAASAAVGARSRMAAAATLVAPAKQAAPATRTLLLPLVMLIPCLGSAFEQVPGRGRTSPHDTKWMLSSTHPRGHTSYDGRNFLGNFVVSPDRRRRAEALEIDSS